MEVHGDGGAGGRCTSSVAREAIGASVGPVQLSWNLELEWSSVTHAVRENDNLVGLLWCVLDNHHCFRFEFLIAISKPDFFQVQQGERLEVRDLDAVGGPDWQVSHDPFFILAGFVIIGTGED